ncbi:serine/threonine-protein kinase [Chondromyces apiculatus]|uniref:Putative serine/threonine-protein kinase pknH n=1 Tax=Chondromyces apiculatus DSM 436 TaxID=1192034 RepID=A0A017T0J1_9BACT|nr:serine/threonine-protein kinase [Chondromyces apiculatus]EYF02507.1 putative serine/threonine-protein kinase pknH [Chondromyces apiculatus DSM 436]
MILHPGTLFHERYRIVRSIQVGGMGAVYEVLDEKTDSGRALKVLLPGTLQSADLRARFEREAKITGGIESNHVVRTLDAGFDDSTNAPFLVMELLRGEELGALVTRQGRLSPSEALLFLRQAALGLDKVHAAGIVHRDLKLGNLYVVTQDDGTPCLKIIDFGVAKAMAPVGGEAGRTRPLGTPLFMAPEQIRGDGRIGPTADVFALAHVAYVLLTGEPYWTEEADEAGSIHGFILAIIQGATDPPTSRALRRQGVTLPAAFDAWFFRATATRPEDRFTRASETVAALAEVFGLPGGVRMPSAPAWPTPPNAPAASPSLTTPLSISAPLLSPAPPHASPLPRPPSSQISPVTGAVAISTSALVHESQAVPAKSKGPLRLALAAGAALLVLVPAAFFLFGRGTDPDPAHGTGTPATADPAAAASRTDLSPSIAPSPTPNVASPTGAVATPDPSASAAASAAASTAATVPRPPTSKTSAPPRPRPSTYHPGID